MTDVITRMHAEIASHYAAEYQRASKPRDTTATRHATNVGAAFSLVGLCLCVLMPVLGIVIAPALTMIGAAALVIGYSSIMFADKQRKNNGMADAAQRLQSDIESGVLIQRYKKDVLAPEVLTLRARISSLRSLAKSFNTSAPEGAAQLSPVTGLAINAHGNNR